MNKFKLHNFSFLNKINSNNTLVKPGEINLDNMNTTDNYIQMLIKNIKDTQTVTEADNMLLNLSKEPDSLEMLDYTNFKYKDYNIKTSLAHFSEPVVYNLNILNKLDLACTPKLISAIKKDNSLYLITKIPGTETGNLKQYYIDGKEKVSKSDKLSTFKDLQKLTKSGFIDEQNLRAGNWFYTPENKIMLPNWNNLRKIAPNESPRKIQEQYYKLIFGD